MKNATFIGSRRELLWDDYLVDTARSTTVAKLHQPGDHFHGLADPQRYFYGKLSKLSGSGCERTHAQPWFSGIGCPFRDPFLSPPTHHPGPGHQPDRAFAESTGRWSAGCL